MTTFRGFLAALGLVGLCFVNMPGEARAAVAGNANQLGKIAAAGQGERLAEPAQSRRRYRCTTRFVRQCRTRYVRRCYRWRAGTCRRWVSRPVVRCYRAPKRVCRRRW